MTKAMKQKNVNMLSLLRLNFYFWASPNRKDFGSTSVYSDQQQQQQQQQHSLSPKLIGVSYMDQTLPLCSIKCN
ncbi:hypothetical protein Scep_009538 [Stephania cephalantha]|uniref:Uncharacterized protein n=1 Tax=Stephania cephalantha TaxID=152367 RepID=A0AAP0JTG3_9MAGN